MGIDEVFVFVIRRVSDISRSVSNLFLTVIAYFFTYISLTKLGPVILCGLGCLYRIPV